MSRKKAGIAASLLKQREAEKRARRRAKDELYLAVFVGLFVLLISLMGLVATFVADYPTGPEAVGPWLKSHQSRIYFIQAKELVRPLVRGTVEKWSVQFYDKETGCAEIANGVWEAIGTVDTRASNGQRAHDKWLVYFLPETNTLLCSRVGAETHGDLAQVQRLVEGTRDESPK